MYVWDWDWVYAAHAMNGNWCYKCEAGTGMRHQHNGKANENGAFVPDRRLALALCRFGIEVLAGLTSLLLCWAKNKIRHPIIIIVSATFLGPFSLLFQKSCCRLPRISLPFTELPPYLYLILSCVVCRLWSFISKELNGPRPHISLTTMVRPQLLHIWCRANASLENISGSLPVRADCVDCELQHKPY